MPWSIDKNMTLAYPLALAVYASWFKNLLFNQCFVIFVVRSRVRRKSRKKIKLKY